MMANGSAIIWPGGSATLSAQTGTYSYQLQNTGMAVMETSIYMASGYGSNE